MEGIKIGLLWGVAEGVKAVPYPPPGYLILVPSGRGILSDEGGVEGVKMRLQGLFLRGPRE